MSKKIPAAVMHLESHRTKRELQAARAALKRTRGLIRLASARSPR